LFLSGVFIFFSFFTKQDGGGLAFLLCIAILVYDALVERKWNALLIFCTSVLIRALAMILPFTKYNVGYWFNHGQAPHSSRISILDILSEFLGASQWLKFYLFVIAVLISARLSNGWKPFSANRKQMLFIILVIGILAEAAIF